ncbi:MAG: methyltransferase domain-containing protein [Actinomycetota bacterium]|nr:methyltransferase domain-containing protein [Actinomycetota bacterium]
MPQEWQPAVHPAAARGFDAAADAYERTRPDYPDEVLAVLADVLDLGPGRVVVDVGAGTGKLSRRLVETGARVVAVEPVAGMRTLLREVLPDLEIRAGFAEALPLGQAEADAIVAAQAFHWFDGEAALAEWHRVLHPGGRLGLVWNVRDEAADWVSHVTALIDRYAGTTPRYRTGAWRQPFSSQRWFGPLHHRRLSNPQRLTLEAIVERVSSISFIAALDGPARSRVLSRVRELLDTHPETRGRRELVLPQVVDLYWAERRSAGATREEPS